MGRTTSLRSRPALWPGEDGLRLWPASPEQADDRQRTTRRRPSRSPWIRKSRRCSSLPPGRSPLPGFSFDEPIATRELEVHGTGGAIRLPDPNAFDGSVFVCKKDQNKTSPKSGWTLRRADWTEFPAEGSAEGRGMGALDLARAVRAAEPRASADLALHVLETWSRSPIADSGQSVSVATTCKLAEPLPATWNPLQKSTIMRKPVGRIFKLCQTSYPRWTRSS